MLGVEREVIVTALATIAREKRIVIEGLNQVWGGATAISRECFESLEVKRLWSWTVVDHVSLSAALKQAGIKVWLAAEEVLTSPV